MRKIDYESTMRVDFRAVFEPKRCLWQWCFISCVKAKMRSALRAHGLEKKLAVKTRRLRPLPPRDRLTISSFEMLS